MSRFLLSLAAGPDLRSAIIAIFSIILSSAPLPHDVLKTPESILPDWFLHCRHANPLLNLYRETEKSTPDTPLAYLPLGCLLCVISFSSPLFLGAQMQKSE